MLLNKIPILDKGWVALVDSYNTTQKLRDIDKEFFGSMFPPNLLDLGRMTLVMKCPLFVQLNLSKFNIRVMNTYEQVSELQAYLPNVGEIGSRERDVCEAVADDIARTTNALFINAKAYRADGVNRFISHLPTPISTYTTLLLEGSYDEWSKFCDQVNAPTPIQAYINAIKDIKDAEWKFS